jgi:hypothetical protein
MTIPALPIGRWAYFHANRSLIWVESMASIAIYQFWSTVYSSWRIQSQSTVRSKWLILDKLTLSRKMIISVYEMQSKIDWMLSILALMKSCTYKSRLIGQRLLLAVVEQC